MVAAAREHGVPLLAVPDDVPFIAVTKAVFAARAAAERAGLEEAVTQHRALTAAAAGSGGLQGLLAVWARSHRAAVVLDPAGRLLASAGEDADLLAAAAEPMVDGLLERGLRASASVGATAGTVRLQPLGARRVRGLLAVSGAGDGADRLVLQGMVSLLSLELERRHLLGRRPSPGAGGRPAAGPGPRGDADPGGAPARGGRAAGAGPRAGRRGRCG